MFEMRGAPGMIFPKGRRSALRICDPAKDTGLRLVVRKCLLRILKSDAMRCRNVTHEGGI